MTATVAAGGRRDRARDRPRPAPGEARAAAQQHRGPADRDDVRGRHALRRRRSPARRVTAQGSAQVTFADFGDGTTTCERELGEEPCECRIPNGAMRPFLVVAVAVGLLSGGLRARQGRAAAARRARPRPGISVAAHGAARHAERGRREPGRRCELVLRNAERRSPCRRACAVLLPARRRATATHRVHRRPGFDLRGTRPDGLVMATDSNGVADVVYVAGTGPRTRSTCQRAALRHRRRRGASSGPSRSSSSDTLGPRRVARGGAGPSGPAPKHSDRG